MEGHTDDLTDKSGQRNIIVIIVKSIKEWMLDPCIREKYLEASETEGGQ